MGDAVNAGGDPVNKLARIHGGTGGTGGSGAPRRMGVRPPGGRVDGAPGPMFSGFFGEVVFQQDPLKSFIIHLSPGFFLESFC